MSRVEVVGTGAVEGNVDDWGMVGYIGAGVGHRAGLDDGLFQG